MFGVLVVGYLIVGVLQGMLGALVGGVILANSDSELAQRGRAAPLINIVALAVTLPFAAALVAYIYFDLRVRKEGFDLQLLARADGGAAARRPAVAGLPPSDAAAVRRRLPAAAAAAAAGG